MFVQPGLSKPFVGLLGTTLFGLVIATSCAYRLPPPNLPSQQRLVIATEHPERYAVKVVAYKESEFAVQTDGRVTIAVPRLPKACSIYLFDRIRIKGAVNPYTTKAIRLVDRNIVARAISLSEIDRLPTDESGFHILKVSE